MSAAFIAAAQARGLIIEQLVADGKIHRAPVDGRPKADRSGWYVLNAPNNGRMFGAYGRWDDGRAADNWCDGQEAKPITKAEQAAITKMRSDTNKQREQEQRDAAKEAQAQWAKFSPDGGSPYLKRKAVDALGVAFDGAVVCIT